MRALVRLRVLAGAWPFGVVELIWSAIALRRWGEAEPVPES
jgi:hypothetical protein